MIASAILRLLRADKSASGYTWLANDTDLPNLGPARQRSAGKAGHQRKLSTDSGLVPVS